MHIMRMKVRVIKFLNSFFKKNQETKKKSIDCKELSKMLEAIDKKLSQGCSTPIVEKCESGLSLKLNHHKHYYLELKLKDERIAAIKIDSGNIALFFKHNRKEIQDKIFNQLISKIFQL